LIDTFFLFFYSFGFFSVGHLGDKYKPKNVLSLTLAGLFLILVIIGIVTEWINEGVLYYIIFFSISGTL
jgi:sugar phosphate permease